eukprot:7666598-Heterocapsa_arctica.AAC.1
MKLLGWRFKEEGAKAQPFSEVFTTLGAVIDLRKSEAENLIFVSNKPERRDKVEDIFSEILKAR